MSDPTTRINLNDRITVTPTPSGAVLLRAAGCKAEAGVPFTGQAWVIFGAIATTFHMGSVPAIEGLSFAVARDTPGRCGITGEAP